MNLASSNQREIFNSIWTETRKIGTRKTGMRKTGMRKSGARRIVKKRKLGGQ